MSEKRKSKYRAGPASSKLRLKLQNSSITDEDTSNNGNTTPVRRLDKRSGHSTPIRNTSVTNNMEDSPEIDYRCSPIMGPCSQQPEVVWNWHSPKGDNSTGANRTPKRTANLQKRRISDSPLMYAPWKVKLKKEERDVNVFIANFEQFNNPPVLPKPEKEPEPSTSDKWPSESENLNNSEKVLESSEDTEMRLVYQVDETRMDTVSEKRNITNLNDLFDDEIDDSMVRFSQQVEEEFFGRLKEEKTESSAILFSGKENESTSNDNPSIRTIEGLHNLMKVPFEKEKEPPKSLSVPKSTYIPDDSFDECLSQFEEVDFSSELKNDGGPRSKLKGLQIRNTDLLSKKSLFSCNSNNTSVKIGSGRSRSFLDSPKLASISERSLVKTKSFEHHSRNGVKNLTKDFVQKHDIKPESHISPRKFFKTKSLSEPFRNEPINSSASINNKETNNNSGAESKRNLVDPFEFKTKGQLSRRLFFAHHKKSRGRGGRRR
ncbi:uncharacterized protein LOC117173098 isoform X2 [Belonocnema kinseyi]|uniref:uncharacterized protein LOC117173098 isoform X2 n=1 Tax=Belonocnema kinseyi TaxID=2817044 RepID=UPI00143D3DB0|nr:uncharacterized protein LOC117173098 isoform X2 [Belonocnema kinseyi]